LARPIDDALVALEAASAEGADPAWVEHVRGSLSDSERLLFDRAMRLQLQLTGLNNRVVRSAQFAEATLGTAAFVHELRQCLAPLMGLSELLSEAPNASAAADWSREIANQTHRLADLVDRHGDLLQGGAAEETACDVRAVVEESLACFTHLPPGVTLGADLPASLPKVRTSRRRFLHALINLIANARDAQSKSPGRVQISAREAGERVEILISDQGEGVDPSVRRRLFEPLFTTKGKNGTGLGLFLSRELLRPNGDVVFLAESDTPEGTHTSFAIRLPIDDGREEVAAREPVAEPGPAGWPVAKEQALKVSTALLSSERPPHVLLVEDEPAVRRMTRAVLESIPDAKIFEAADAASARAVLNQLPVDLVLCDKNLPDESGLAVIRFARERSPAIDAMIVTGYPSPDSASEAIRMGATDYLLKPIREIKALRQTVTSALERQKLFRLWRKQPEAWLSMAKELQARSAKDSPMRRSLDLAIEHWTGSNGAEHAVVAVVADAEARRALETAGLEVLMVADAASLRTEVQNIDLVLFPAESSSTVARDVLSAARDRELAAHLLPVGRFTSTETAVAAIEGRSGAVVNRPLVPSEALEMVKAAVARRRLDVRATLLKGLLAEIGCKV
jgi:signal transduction histidine kinase/response regulator of citrate/malate metabolism